MTWSLPVTLSRHSVLAGSNIVHSRSLCCSGGIPLLRVVFFRDFRFGLKETWPIPYPF
jgi:hypothetical protein